MPKEVKDKQPLILLHGALGTKKEFSELVPLLENDFNVYSFNFEGHGDGVPTDQPFRISRFAENVLNFMDENRIDTSFVFGFSMGGYAALTAAKKEPRRIKKAATLGTILQWNKETANRECRYLLPGKIEEKVPRFAAKLDERHPNGWKEVVDKTREMLQYLGENPNLSEKDWEEFRIPVRLHIGDRDTTAGFVPTFRIYKKMPSSELHVLPATPHPLEKADKEKLAASLRDFFL